MPARALATETSKLEFTSNLTETPSSCSFNVTLYFMLQG